MCSCDAYALEVLHYLQHERQLRVPEDVGLIGFDHIDMLKYVQPHLTTVEYNVELMGREAVRLLLERIESGSEAVRRETIVEYAIISGSSI